MIKLTLIVMIANALSRLIGFFRDIFVGNVLGTSSTADAYLAATSVPNMLFANVAAAVATTFIPLYIKQKEKEGEKKALHFFNNTACLVLVFSVVMCLASVLFSQQILSFLVAGFKQEVMDTAISVSKVVFWSGLFIGINCLLTSYLEIQNKFIVHPLSVIPFNIVIILSLVMYGKYGIMGVCYATVAGFIIQFSILLISSLANGLKLKLTSAFKDENVKTMLLLSLPVFIGTSVNQINALVDKLLASGLVEGSIAALDYSYKLQIFVFTVTSGVIAAIIYPSLSKLGIQNNTDAFKSLLMKSFGSITAILLPISIGACVLAQPTISLLFERGAFNSQSTSMTASAMFFYSIGMLFVGYRELLCKAFYAQGDTRTPMNNSIVAVVFNVCLSLIFVRFMKHNGLALATSMAAFVSTLFLSFRLTKKIGFMQKLVQSVVKTAISSAVMGVAVAVAFSLMQSLFFQSVFYVKAIMYVCVVSLGGFIYLILQTALKNDDVTIVVKKVVGRSK